MRVKNLANNSNFTEHLPNYYSLVASELATALF